jgi:UDP-perosamine 4-acetyltransferase
MIAIIGAGGHAKCVYECFYSQEQNVYGFFDDDRAKTGLELINRVRVLGTVDDIAGHEGIQTLFVAVGDNRQRLAIYRLYKNRGYAFPNAFHEKAHFSKFAANGEGNFMMGPAVVNPGARIGNCCIINTSATVGHDCTLEDGVQIGPGVNIAGGSTLKEGAFIGIGAKVGPGVTVGPWSVIGAGSVVLKDMPGRSFIFGVPAKVVKNNIQE